MCYFSSGFRAADLPSRSNLDNLILSLNQDWSLQGEKLISWKTAAGFPPHQPDSRICRCSRNETGVKVPLGDLLFQQGPHTMVLPFLVYLEKDQDTWVSSGGWLSWSCLSKSAWMCNGTKYAQTNAQTKYAQTQPEFQWHETRSSWSFVWIQPFQITLVGDRVGSAKIYYWLTCQRNWQEGDVWAELNLYSSADRFFRM